MSLMQELKCALPMLPPVDLDNLFLDLSILGVDQPADMKYVKEADLKVLKPIHARKLLDHFKEKNHSNATATSFASDLASTEYPLVNGSLDQKRNEVLKEKTSAMNNTREQHATLIQCDDSSYIRNYKVPMHNLRATIKESLVKDFRLSPADRRLLVRVIVDDLVRKIPRPRKKDLAVVAKRVVDSYPNSLQDTVDGKVIGTGFSSFLNQLVSRVENVFRNSTQKIRKRKSVSSTDTESPAPSRKWQLVDSYGCIRYNMQVEEEKRETLESVKKALQQSFLENETDESLLEMQFQQTYPLQREEIIEGVVPFHELKDHWPYLFRENGFYSHAQILLGFHLEETLGRVLEEKTGKMLEFFRSVQNKNEDIKKHVFLSATSDNSAVALFYLLMAHFKESPDDSLFHVFETSVAKKDVEQLIPSYPCIVAYGDSMYNAEEFDVAVDGKLLFQHLSSFTSSVAVMFGTYYVFSIQYPVEAACTLEFIQRFFLKINPLDATSSKSEKVKGKNGSNRKVFSLITEMAYYESTVECNIKPESHSEDSYYSEDSSAMNSMVIQPSIMPPTGYHQSETSMNGCEEFVVSDIDISSLTKRQKRSKAADNYSHIHESAATQTLHVPNDPITLYALSLVDRLKELERQKRYYAMCKIQELLYEAEYNTNSGFS